MTYNIIKDSSNSAIQLDNYNKHLEAYNKLAAITGNKLTIKEYISNVRQDIEAIVNKDAVISLYSNEKKSNLVEELVNQNDNVKYINEILTNTPHYASKPILIEEDLSKLPEYKVLEATLSNLSKLNISTNNIKEVFNLLVKDIDYKLAYESTKPNAYKLSVDTFINIKRYL